MANSHKLVAQADAHAPAVHASTHSVGGSDAMTAPYFTTIELGAASDTTIARASAGNLTVEGNALYRAGGTDVAVADGGTGASTAGAGFNALSPMTTSGDTIYGGASGAGTRLAKGTDGQVLTLASGLPSWAAAAGGGTSARGHIYHSATQTVGNGVEGALAFDSERSDTGAAHDTSTNNSRVIPLTAGRYLVTGSMQIDTNAAASFIAIKKNGSDYGAVQSLPAVGVYHAISAQMDVNGSTDYFELMFFNASGTTRTVSASSATGFSCDLTWTGI